MTGDDDPDIAIIGYAGRFPGARDAGEFWDNLKSGVESLSFFGEAESIAAGADPAVVRDPRYVPAAPVLDDVDGFDAGFFGYSPREATVLDPQQRIMLECAHEALEYAGHDPGGFDGTIGVYAGASLNTYLLFGDLLPYLRSDYLFTVLASDKDFLTSRISYELGLTGPSVTVQAACSTALVAVHTAAQSLLARECDMALAGGVSVRVPHRAGYLYEEGGILSPDGHCRAFDAAAQGTVFGSGAGLVVLRRLAEAVADGDRIHAVIKGSAVNNDGSAKAGFAAPSVAGQAAAVIEAIARAGVDPETLSYVEAHGTGTALGDPIEIAALTAAFRAYTARTGFCAIGSVKTNIGHTDAAAGVLSLIKTVLALEHGLLPPTLHFTRPNPELKIDETPFRVNAALTAWPRTGVPRRAGVNCLGMGGTNAFLVLQEAPAAEPSGPGRAEELIRLSARTESALDAASLRLADHLADRPDLSLADVAYTLRAGRRDMAYGRVLVCRDTVAAAALLRNPRDPAVLSGRRGPPSDGVVFLFPGQGTQYPGMALGLRRDERVFRRHLDACAEILRPLLGWDLTDLLDSTDLHRTELAQPALFAVEYALARLWMSWGVQPVACLGHSLGEYVAACVCGVFSLADALKLVTVRGRLMGALPDGAMLSVPLTEADVQPYLSPEISLAAVNATAQVVVAGPPGAIGRLNGRLAGRGIRGMLLPASRAFHSAAVDPVAGGLASEVRRIDRRPPVIPYVSNVTGTWITDEQATDPDHWSRHARGTVRFADGIRTLLDGTDGPLLEAGAGATLGTLARRSLRRPGERAVLASLPGARDGGADEAFLLRSVGRLWLAGVGVDQAAFDAGQRRHRVPLPPYPFERSRYWVSPSGAAGARVAEGVPAAAVPRPTDTGATALEGAIAAVWREALGIERLGPGDDFFELGGSSVLIPGLLARLNEMFDVDLPVLTLLEAPTVAGLADRIEAVHRLTGRSARTDGRG